MKKRFGVLLVLILAVCWMAVGCGTQKTGSASSSGSQAQPSTSVAMASLTGTWVFEKDNNKSIVQAVGQVSGSITLNADGTGSVTYRMPKQSEKHYNGTYTQTADKVTISSPDLKKDVSLGYSVDDQGLLNVKYQGVTVKLTKK